MPLIQTHQDLFTVIVVVDAEPSVMTDIVEHARYGITAGFPDCRGYVGGALHVSDDGRRLVQYLQWESEESYIACRDDPVWDALPAGRRLMQHLRAGRADLDVRSYVVVLHSDTPK